MAASVAPTSTRTPRIPATNTTTVESSSSSSYSSEKIPPKESCNSNSENIIQKAQKPSLNSQELCRSCGKTTEDLYDLYHHQPAINGGNSNNNNALTLPQSTSSTLDETTMPSPFTTSSTTCYAAKSCTASTTLPANSTTTSDSHNNTASCLSSSANTAISSGTSATTTTFDSVAATAKATAKGQSNMENILQEMQIWHLQVSSFFPDVLFFPLSLSLIFIVFKNVNIIYLSNK